jgi:hypothetical protein
VLGGTFVHIVFFHFIFNFFFGFVHVGVPYSAGHGYGVASVRREPDRLAVSSQVPPFLVVSLYS